MKICNTCNLSKKLSEFGKDGKKADGTVKLKGHCLECDRDRKRKARAANPELSRESRRRWREKNPEAVKASNREWHENNPERAAEKNRRWHLLNPERSKENTRIWSQNNKDAVRGSGARYRAAKKNATIDDLPREYMKIVKDFYGNVCLNQDCASTEDLTVDHVVPLHCGGEHSFRNFQILCRKCNSSKKHLRETDYRSNIILIGWNDGPITEERDHEVSQNG